MPEAKIRPPGVAERIEYIYIYMAASRLFVCTESGASRGLGEDIPGPARHKLCPSSLQAELSQARPEADDEALAKAFETAFAATPA